MRAFKINISRSKIENFDDVHVVPDYLDSMSPEEAYGTGHEAGSEDEEELMSKIKDLYDQWTPEKEDELASRYKKELGDKLIPKNNGGCAH